MSKILWNKILIQICLYKKCRNVLMGCIFNTGVVESQVEIGALKHLT